MFSIRLVKFKIARFWLNIEPLVHSTVNTCSEETCCAELFGVLFLYSYSTSPIYAIKKVPCKWPYITCRTESRSDYRTPSSMRYSSNMEER